MRDGGAGGVGRLGAGPELDDLCVGSGGVEQPRHAGKPVLRLGGAGSGIEKDGDHRGRRLSEHDEARLVHQLVEIARHRSLEDQALARDGMRHGDAPRVEGLARKRAQCRGERRVGDLQPSGFAVRRVADDRPAARRQVDADLMRAAGDEAAAEQRQPGAGCGHAREPLESCEAGRADMRRRDDPARIVAILAEPQIDLAACHVHAAVDHGEIVLLAGRGVAFGGADGRSTPSCAGAPREPPPSWRRRRPRR